MIADFIAIGLTSLNFIFPAAEFNDFFCKVDEENSDVTPYDEAMRKFATDYDRANPITMQKAMNEWVSLVEGEGDGKEEKMNVDGLLGYVKGNADYNNVIQKNIIRKNVQVFSFEFIVVLSLIWVFF